MIGKRGSILDRKGQNVTITTLILIVLGVIVLVLLVTGFIIGWDRIIDIITIGGGLDQKLQKCNAAASFDAVFEFCEYEEVRIEGEKEWVNCEDSRLEPLIAAEVGTANIPECPAEYSRTKFCEENELSNEEYVNGEQCSSSGSSSSGGGTSQSQSSISFDNFKAQCDAKNGKILPKDKCEEVIDNLEISQSGLTAVCCK